VHQSFPISSCGLGTSRITYRKCFGSTEVPGGNKRRTHSLCATRDRPGNVHESSPRLPSLPVSTNGPVPSVIVSVTSSALTRLPLRFQRAACSMTGRRYLPRQLCESTSSVIWSATNSDCSRANLRLVRSPAASCGESGEMKFFAAATGTSLSVRREHSIRLG
jgi:hypothetical protein